MLCSHVIVGKIYLVHSSCKTHSYLTEFKIILLLMPKRFITSLTISLSLDDLSSCSNANSTITDFRLVLPVYYVMLIYFKLIKIIFKFTWDTSGKNRLPNLLWKEFKTNSWDLKERRKYEWMEKLKYLSDWIEPKIPE